MSKTNGGGVWEIFQVLLRPLETLSERKKHLSKSGKEKSASGQFQVFLARVATISFLPSHKESRDKKNILKKKGPANILSF